jgi:hypothetical protein
MNASNVNDESRLLREIEPHAVDFHAVQKIP